MKTVEDALSVLVFIAVMIASLAGLLWLVKAIWGLV